MKRAILIPVLLLLVLVAWSQEKLILEDIYKNETYTAKGYGPVRWMKDNKGYSTLESNSKVGGFDIIRYEAKSGARSVLVSAEKLINVFFKTHKLSMTNQTCDIIFSRTCSARLPDEAGRLSI